MPLSFVGFTSLPAGRQVRYKISISVSFLLLALLLFVSPQAFARSSDDPADVVDQQRAFLDQTMQNIEHQRLEHGAEKKAEAERRLRLQKKRTERRLAEQLKGLSGTLSGLPELPNFNGKFETMDSGLSGQDSEGLNT